MADEELIEEEGGEVVEEEGVEEGIAEDSGGIQASEFIPEAAPRAKSDVYTLILILTFVAFLTGIIIAGRELHETYDVQFWVFTKD